VQIEHERAPCVLTKSLRVLFHKIFPVDLLTTVFPRIDAAAFIYFVGQFGAATIRGRRLFKGGIYSFWQ